MSIFTNEAAHLSAEVAFAGVVVMSGVRPSGKLVVHTEGRKRHGILYILSGSVSFSRKGYRKLVVQKDAVVVIPKGASYVLRYEAESTEFCLVDFDVLSQTDESLTLTDGIIHIPNMSRLSELFGKLRSYSLDESSFSFFKRRELFYKLLSEIFCGEGIRPESLHGKYASIIPGLNLLQTRYLEDIPVTELAAASHLSVSSFRRIFTEYCGASPIQYRNLLRVRRAMALLAEGHLTVREVSEASGFENEGYFFRYFKKITGETPNQYRYSKLNINR